jgi:hypothetical protein
MDLKTRAINMVTRPADEWRVVAAESHTVSDLMTGYALPLAAIPAVCGFIGQSIVGFTVPLVGTFRTPIGRGLVGVCVQLVLSLVGAYISAIVIEKLAANFQSRGSTVDALKLVVFAMTPVWLAGIVNIIPALGLLVLLAALYSIYVFYLGLPVIMNTPQSQVVPYMAVSALVIIVLSIVFGMVTAALVGAGAYTAGTL